MIKQIFLFIILIKLTSCYHENKEVVAQPETLLSEDQIVKIITDLQLAEGILSFNRLQHLPVIDVGETLYKKVFDEYGVTPKQLQQNFDYYNSYPKQMEMIYDKVLAQLTKIQSELMIAKTESDSAKSELMDSTLISEIDSIRFRENLVLIPKEISLNKNDEKLKWEYQTGPDLSGFIY